MRLLALHALRICLLLLGASAICIALSIFILGAGRTASSAEHVLAVVSGWPAPPSERWPPSMDSELRFYAAFWGAYGVLVLKTASAPRERMGSAPWLAAIFFAGGIGRLLSRYAVGPPLLLFTILMVIELAAPALITGLWLAARRPLSSLERR